MFKATIATPLTSLAMYLKAEYVVYRSSYWHY